MLFSSLNTGSTDFRDTEVQQPNTTATLSLVISSRAFSAKSGQFEAGSTTTASSFLPSSPPFLFCSSISISITSLRVVSLMAIVPERECRTPTLIVSCALPAPAPAANAAISAAPPSTLRLVSDISISLLRLFLRMCNEPVSHHVCQSQDDRRSERHVAGPKGKRASARRSCAAELPRVKAASDCKTGSRRTPPRRSHLPGL